MTDFANIFFPTERLSYPTLGNPAFVDDIVAANELLRDGLAALLGLYNNDQVFAIISGLEYDENAHTYAPGIFFLAGKFYYMQTGFAEGLYLSGKQVQVMPKVFSDTNTKNIYANYVGQTTNIPVGSSPQFMSDMDSYRVGIYQSRSIQLALQSVVASLGDAAFLNVGTIPGTVAAGNDPRLVGDVNYFLAKYVQRVNAIEKNLPNAPAAYTPVNGWDPVNKAYSDATSGRRIASGSLHIGDADSIGGTAQNIQLGVVVPNAAYLIDFSTGSLSANHNIDIFYHPTWANKLPGSFDIWFKEAQAGVQNIQVDWIIWAI